jgi:peptide/nickel transport system permease protein
MLAENLKRIWRVALLVREPASSLIRVMTTHLNGIPLFSLAIILMVIGAAIFAESLAPHSPFAGSLRHRLAPPFWLDGGNVSHPLGTDDLGRDILSRLIYGARMSLIVAAAAVLGAGTLGVALGLLAGYYGRTADALIMRLTDAAQAIPLILVALLFVVTLGQGSINVVIALVVLLWSRYTRVVRGEVLSLKSRDYIALARVAGASDTRIILRHILPNTFNTIVVLMTLQVGIVILVEASLSFLGAGVPPPNPAWGSMVAEGRDFVANAWWISFFPGLAVMLTVLACNLLGDWVRDRLDPQLRQI